MADDLAVIGRRISLWITMQGAEHRADEWELRTAADVEEFRREAASYVTAHLAAVGSFGEWGLRFESVDPVAVDIEIDTVNHTLASHGGQTFPLVGGMICRDFLRIGSLTIPVWKEPISPAATEDSFYCSEIAATALAAEIEKEGPVAGTLCINGAGRSVRLVGFEHMPLRGRLRLSLVGAEDIAMIAKMFDVPESML